MRAWYKLLPPSLLSLVLIGGYVLVAHSGGAARGRESADPLLVLAGLACSWLLLVQLRHQRSVAGSRLCKGAHKLRAPQVHFRALSPAAFLRVREAAGWTAERLAGALEFEEGVGGLKGGASGAFLFPTSDGSLVVKTLRCTWHTDEVATLVRAAAAFAEHFERHPGSLIARVYGVYSMRLCDLRLEPQISRGAPAPLHASCRDRYSRTFFFVLLSNICVASRGRAALMKYDLKGSWVNRAVYPAKHPDATTLKDMDLVEEGLVVEAPTDGGHAPPPGSHEALPIRIGGSRYDLLMQQLQHDTRLLLRLGIMDYSLLLAVYPHGTCDAEPEGEAAALVRGYGNRRVDLVLGILDITQQWTLKCRLARLKKTAECVLRGRDPAGISTVPVDEYQSRFVSFMGERLFAADEP